MFRTSCATTTKEKEALTDQLMVQFHLEQTSAKGRFTLADDWTREKHTPQRALWSYFGGNTFFFYCCSK